MPMFLNLLSREEKHYFIDLLIKVIAAGGEADETELQIINLFKNEMGEDAHRYRKSSHDLEKLVKYFASKTKAIKNIVFLNLVRASLIDEFYSAEEHFIIEQIQEKFGITNKKKTDLMKIVYAERDLNERAKRVIAE
jgi:hypothetical protein